MKIRIAGWGMRKGVLEPVWSSGPILTGRYSWQSVHVRQRRWPKQCIIKTWLSLVSTRGVPILEFADTADTRYLASSIGRYRFRFQILDCQSFLQGWIHAGATLSPRRRHPDPVHSGPRAPVRYTGLHLSLKRFLC